MTNDLYSLEFSRGLSEESVLLPPLLLERQDCAPTPGT